MTRTFEPGQLLSLKPQRTTSLACGIVWTMTQSPRGSAYEVLAAECVKHGWRWASHDHGSVADAARDHVALVVGHYV